MKTILAIGLMAASLSACNSGNSETAAMSGDRKSAAVSLTDNEKHKLYSAALAASESPLDTEIFKDVCKKIRIFDANGTPNDRYMAFVSEHVDWGMKLETEQFRQEINSKEKARDYISRHLPR